MVHFTAECLIRPLGSKIKTLQFGMKSFTVLIVGDGMLAILSLENRAGGYFPCQSLCRVPRAGVSVSAALAVSLELRLSGSFPLLFLYPLLIVTESHSLFQCPCAFGCCKTFVHDRTGSSQ